MNKSTRDWLDLYDMMLDRMFEFLKDPLKGALNRGITEKELAEQSALARLPQKMDMASYHELKESWKRVRATMQIFGLELGDDLEIAPLAVLQPDTKAFRVWLTNPRLEVSRGLEKPLVFEGRDALTALGFLNVYIQQCETVDPAARIRQVLEAQGITKDNFHERVGAGSGIRNPWDTDSPQQPKKG